MWACADRLRAVYIYVFTWMYYTGLYTLCVHIDVCHQMYLYICIHIYMMTSHTCIIPGSYMHSHSFITMGSRFYMYIYTYIHIYKKVYMYMCIHIYVHINMTSNMLIILGSRLWATVDWITKLKASGEISQKSAL